MVRTAFALWPKTLRGGVIFGGLVALFGLQPSLLAQNAQSAASDNYLAWPAPTATARPWTRWWWLGSAVDQPNLQRLLTLYRQAGIGGVEICPIYGAKGYENRYLDFLSPAWMGAYNTTTEIAQSLGLGVDLTTGTGWPYGGPWVTPEMASSSVGLKSYALAAGARLTEPLPKGQLRCLTAVDTENRSIDLLPLVHEGQLDWKAPAGQWRLYAISQDGPVQEVKRAAPGGHGHVLDPYSTVALDKYLAHFDAAFKSAPRAPRAEFHDSFEYYGATWTSDFFQAFEKTSGYDLRTELPAFFGEGLPDRVARVKRDYRATLSELHEAYIARWTEWSHAHGSLSREQAHGAPANLEDLYAKADIPETEIFGEPNENLLPMLQFASSAAHVTGRNLASSETFTWRGEHFQVSLADLKSETDFLFLAGFNHLFFHGIPYSPEDAPWPGWLFYAAVNFGPNGGLWHDLPAFTAYATRCQSILQSGQPDNDLLLYFPVEDFWQTPDGMTVPFGMPGKWMHGTSFHDDAMLLWNRGYSYDEVTDHFLEQTSAEGDGLRLGGHRYRTILIPTTRVMSVSTLRQLVDLAQKGVTILVQDALPHEVPGLGELTAHESELHRLLDALATQPVAGTQLRESKQGQGRFLIGSNLDELLSEAKVPREPMADVGLRCIRRRTTDGIDYFIANRGSKKVDDWIPIDSVFKSAALLDPRFADVAGAASIRRGTSGNMEVYLQLEPGESRILRTSRLERLPETAWSYAERGDASAEVPTGDWSVHFVEGGPALPKDYTSRVLGSWTERDDPEAKRFAGTARYTLAFDFQPGSADDWQLDLGRVCESARVTVNGHAIGTLWCEPFHLRVGRWLQPGKNTLEIEVTNVAANRIADLDRRHVPWKNFQEINFVGKNYKTFDASHWPLRDSGLIGPVTLIPLKTLKP